MVYIVTVIYIAAAAVQIVYVKKNKKELVIALVITFVAMLYTYGYLMNWELPTISSVMDAALDPLSEKVFGSSHK